ncbi:hypothetical protein BCV70DRAFT_43336 [Testicularia cyperi]|uniref:Uncharacterized protein n=1 Tax=Testicularia cyperi TaxID=1882483 RepID=A0A317XJC5_9BASI|nr:hypothetical protein BCV70DRAFT_43336 [Testicularia cyperi]
MAIFGLKQPNSSTSDTSSSLNKRHSHASSLRQHSLNQSSDNFPDNAHLHSPSASSSRRGISQSTDASSLRSRQSFSMKKFFGSTRRKGSQSIDSTSNASDFFANARASRTSLHKTTEVPRSPPIPSVPTSATAPSLSTPTGAGGSLVDAVNNDVTGGLSATTPSSGPRPSELFAGKGVQWQSIDLTSRELSHPTEVSRPVDMQKFLKERRQWIPTFKDDTADDKKDEAAGLAKALDEISFDGTSDLAKSSAGLMSLRDLEDTHKRREALLTSRPIVSKADGTIFEEAGPSSLSRAGSTSASGSATGSKAPPPPAAPARNQSFRTSTLAASSVNGSMASRKSGSMSRKPVPTVDEFGQVNGTNGGALSASDSTRDIPQRRSSVQKPRTPENGTAAAAAASNLNDDGSQPANSRVDQLKEAAGVRQSSDTSTGFATPHGGLSQDGHDAAGAAAGAGATVPPSSPPLGEAPPRPPKNGQRTPSRQNSQEPLFTASSSTSNLQPAEHTQVSQTALEKVDEVAAKAAPALQNAVPGTGAPAQP